MYDQKITCVVVTYNRKKCLYQNLAALLMQTRPLDEIIIVDNACTDGTYKYVSEIVKKIQLFIIIDYQKTREEQGDSHGE